MILYVDGSALVKPDVEEPGRVLVLDAVAQATVITTMLLTYTDTRATSARLQRPTCIGVVSRLVGTPRPMPSSPNGAIRQ